MAEPREAFAVGKVNAVCSVVPQQHLPRGNAMCWLWALQTASLQNVHSFSLRFKLFTYRMWVNSRVLSRSKFASFVSTFHRLISKPHQLEQGYVDTRPLLPVMSGLITEALRRSNNFLVSPSKKTSEWHAVFITGSLAWGNHTQNAVHFSYLFLTRSSHCCVLSSWNSRVGRCWPFCVTRVPLSRICCCWCCNLYPSATHFFGTMIN